MASNEKKPANYLVEIERLRSRLNEVEESLGAIQRGEVDALVVSGPNGNQIFTLQGAEHPYRLLVEAMNEGAATLVPDGTVLYCNRRLAEILEVPLEKVIGASLQSFFPAAERETVKALVERGRSQAVREEVDLDRGKGVRPLHLSLNPFTDAGTEAVGLVVTDLSGLKTAEKQRLVAEQALLAEEERHSQILANIKDYAIFMLDKDGRIVSWDLGAERVQGYRPQEILGRHFSCLHSPEDVKQGSPEHELRMAREVDRFETEAWRVRADGTRFWANVIVRCLRDEQGEVQGYVKVTRDVTEKKKSEEALRQLSSHLIQSQDYERRRIARELHDSEAQDLSALLMSLSKFKRHNTHLDKESEAILADCTELANQCLRGVRTLSYLLHPPLLDELGLLSALHWYIEGFGKRSGIAVEVDLPKSIDRLPSDVEMSLFRVVQESLTNIHRHSGSPIARISLKQADSGLHLKVEDNGKGIDAAKLEKKNEHSMIGIGIAGMRERLRQLGGELTIESAPGLTMVRATVPLEVLSRLRPPESAASAEVVGRPEIRSVRAS